MTTPPAAAALFDATAAAWRAGQQAARADAQAVCKPALDTPFASFDDAVARLLPYHVLGAEEAESADADDAAALGGSLLISRLAQWDDMVARRAALFSGNVASLSQQQAAAAAKVAAPGPGLLPEERYVCERLALDELRQRRALGQAAMALQQAAQQAAVPR